MRIVVVVRNEALHVVADQEDEHRSNQQSSNGLDVAVHVSLRLEGLGVKAHVVLLQDYAAAVSLDIDTDARQFLHTVIVCTGAWRDRLELVSLDITRRNFPTCLCCVDKITVACHINNI